MYIPDFYALNVAGTFKQYQPIGSAVLKPAIFNFKRRNILSGDEALSFAFVNGCVLALECEVR